MAIIINEQLEDNEAIQTCTPEDRVAFAEQYRQTLIRYGMTSEEVNNYIYFAQELDEKTVD